MRVGETALAFYNAKNPTDKPIIGISTYTIVPWQAGYYFNKIQVLRVNVVSEYHKDPMWVASEASVC